jgi:rare lipoprotein A
MVRVTNLRNGKSVLVRINDRGPFIKGRSIDLTMVPARQIEMISDGIVPVKIEVLKKIEIIRKPNRVLEQGR